MIGFILLGLAAYEGSLLVQEYRERLDYWTEARSYSDEVGKPLLCVGIRRKPFQPPNGDVTLDLDPVVTQIPGGVQGDVTDMPFTNKEFGACICTHILEHLESQEDVDRAVNECMRVADKAFFLCPSPRGIWASFFCKDHHLRIWFDQDINTIKVGDNPYNTGLGVNSDRAYTNEGKLIRRKGIGQALVSTEVPTVSIRS